MYNQRIFILKSSYRNFGDKATETQQRTVSWSVLIHPFIHHQVVVHSPCPHPVPRASLPLPMRCLLLLCLLAGVVLMRFAYTSCSLWQTVPFSSSLLFRSPTPCATTLIRLFRAYLSQVFHSVICCGCCCCFCCCCWEFYICFSSSNFCVW
jgi:hypothetical protein